MVKPFEGTQVFIDNEEHRQGWKFRRLTDEEKCSQICNHPNPCVDIMFYNPANKTIMPCYRKAEPKSGWWYVGGTIDGGKLCREATALKVLQDTKLTIDPTRFEFLGITEMITSTRGWPKPVRVDDEPGNHYVIVVYALALTPEEAAQIRLDPGEYDQQRGIRECTREDILNEDLREELLVAYDHIFPPREDVYELALSFYGTGEQRHERVKRIEQPLHFIDGQRQEALRAAEALAKTLVAAYCRLEESYSECFARLYSRTDAAVWSWTLDREGAITSSIKEYGP